MRTFSTVELTGRNQRYKPRERALRIPRTNKATTTRFPAEGGGGLTGVPAGKGAGKSVGAVTEVSGGRSGVSVLEFASLASGSGINAASASGSSTGWRFLNHSSSSLVKA